MEAPRHQIRDQEVGTEYRSGLLDAILTLAYGNLVLADGIDSYSPGRRSAVAVAVGALVASAD